MKKEEEKGFHKFSILLDKKTHSKLTNMAKNRGQSLNSIIEETVKKGLDSEDPSKSEDRISKVVRRQIEVVLKPHIERLAALSSKSGHMAATATFLGTQAIMDLVPKENRKLVKGMYEKARKKSVEYMRIRTEDWDDI